MEWCPEGAQKRADTQGGACFRKLALGWFPRPLRGERQGKNIMMFSRISSSRIPFTAFALAFTLVGFISAQDETKPEAAKPVKAAKPTRAELRDKQLDVSLEARDIERILGRLKKASELSKQRITEAAKTAESASTSLDKGDSKAARAEARQTAEMFREIAKQLEALLKEEAPQQIAEARQMAQQLAKAEREFAEKFQGAMNPVQAAGMGKVDPRSQVRPMTDPDLKRNGGQTKTAAQAQNGGVGKSGEKKEDDQNSEKKETDGKNGENQDGSGGDKPNDKKRDGSGGGSSEDRQNNKDRSGGAGLTAEQLREMVADRADKLAESGRTLQDVLNEIAKSTDPNDKDAVAKIQAVLKEIDINKVVAEMGQVSHMIRSKQDDDAKLSSLDTAERLEIMAQRLDAAYRGIVAPQAEELRKLEQALADLREQMETLETPSQVAAWHREVRELLDRLDKLGVSPKDREYLEKEMQKAGFGLDVDRTKRTPDWSLVDGRYVAPDGYAQPLVRLQEDIQERIQTLILGDLGNVSDDATPPKYQEFVERYYEVLSRRGGKADSAGKPATRNTNSEASPTTRAPRTK